MFPLEPLFPASVVDEDVSLVLALAGELDVATAPVLRRTVDELLSPHQGGHSRPGPPLVRRPSQATKGVSRVSVEEQPRVGIPVTETARPGSWTIVALTGDIDLATVPALLTTVLAAATNSDAGIVVDLRSVDFIDVTGVNALVRVRNHLRYPIATYWSGPHRHPCCEC